MLKVDVKVKNSRFRRVQWNMIWTKGTLLLANRWVYHLRLFSQFLDFPLFSLELLFPRVKIAEMFSDSQTPHSFSPSSSGHNITASFQMFSQAPNAVLSASHLCFLRPWVTFLSNWKHFHCFPPPFVFWKNRRAVNMCLVQVRNNVPPITHNSSPKQVDTHLTASFIKRKLHLMQCYTLLKCAFLFWLTVAASNSYIFSTY